MCFGADLLASSECVVGKERQGWKIFPSTPVFCPIPVVGYSPDEKNPARALQPPSRMHWMGTDDLGRDVAACVVHGARRSVVTALLAVVVCLAMAVVMGAVPGFLGDRSLHLPVVAFAAGGLGFLAGAFYDFWWTGAPMLCLVGGAAGVGLGFGVARRWRVRRSAFALDTLCLRVGEIWHSTPVLLVLTLSTALLPHRYHTAGVALGLLQWPAAAWALRAQTLRVRNYDFVAAAYAAGAGDFRVFVRHVLPNALPAVAPVLSAVAAQSVVAEAALAFLGLGPEYVSWGALVAAARKYPHAWWLTVFPALFMFLFVRFLHRRGTDT
ncbi:MAG: ABC transporter permease [Bacteroidia bacterium]|nr:ABC transporter permease [Bacteroidia bacterium]